MHCLCLRNTLSRITVDCNTFCSSFVRSRKDICICFLVFKTSVLKHLRMINFWSKHLVFRGIKRVVSDGYTLVNVLRDALFEILRNIFCRKYSLYTRLFPFQILGRHKSCIAKLKCTIDVCQSQITECYGQKDGGSWVRISVHRPAILQGFHGAVLTSRQRSKYVHETRTPYQNIPDYRHKKVILRTSTTRKKFKNLEVWSPKTENFGNEHLKISNKKDYMYTCTRSPLTTQIFTRS